MGKIKIDDILSKVVIPLAVYLMIGLFVFSLRDNTNWNPFVLWSVVSGLIFVLKDTVQNKIVTWGIWIYVLGVILWFSQGQDKEGSAQAAFMLIGILAMAILRFLQKYPMVYIVIGYSSIFLLVFMTIKEYDVSKELVLLSVFLLLYAVSETLAWREKRRLNNKSLILMYALVSVITFWAPVSQEPYGWEFVENIKNTIQEGIQNLVIEIDYQWHSSKKNDVFRVNFLGYSQEEDSLKNSIKDSDIPQLGLVGRRTKRNLYLKGNVTNCFTGETWKNSLAGETLDNTTETLMMMYAIYSYYNQDVSDELSEPLLHLQNKDSIQRFVDSYEYQIRFKNLKTRSLFYPLKTVMISAEPLRIAGDNLQSKTTQERGYFYNIEFLDMDYASLVLQDIIEHSYGMAYDEQMYYALYENMEQYFEVKIEEVSFEEFINSVAQGKESIQAIYGIVDEPVSESVMELAGTIVENCENDYQKCKALERFLGEYYQYNKGVSIPDGANVLDWFLFKQKEGYCTHFATALVEMLRSVGIPARMAEGFLVDYSVSESVDSYVISSQHTHAWTEAYVDGFGWIRLDATASGSSGNTVWYPNDSSSDTPDVNNRPTWNESFLEEQLEELRKEEEQRLEEELHRKEEEKRNWILAIILIAGMLVVILLLCVILLIYQRVKVKNSKNPNVIFGDIMKLLKHKYREKEEGETLKEYFEHIVQEDEYEKENPLDYEGILRSLEAYWYGGRELNVTEIETLQKFRNEIKETRGSSSKTNHKE